MDWLDLLAVQGSLKSLLQHHSSKASILWCTSHIHHWVFFFCFGSIPSFFLELFLHWSPVASWAPTDPTGSPFSSPVLYSRSLLVVYFKYSSDVEAETPILWPPDAKSWPIGKDPNAGEDWGQDEKGTTEDEMAGWHHPLDGHGFGWTPGVGDGQGRPGMLQFMGSQKVGHDWATECVYVNPKWLIYSSPLLPHR